jgi:hypothetical protein
LFWSVLAAEYFEDDDDDGDDDDDENNLTGADLIFGKIFEENLLPATK